MTVPVPYLMLVRLLAPDLLAEVAGIMLGTADGKGPEYQARARAVAEQCRLAGADAEAIPGWIEVGQERRPDTRRPPPPGPLRGSSRS